MYLPLEQYQRLRQALRHVPEELLKLEVACGACAKKFKPDWLKKRPPLIPVTPNPGTGRWIPFGASIACPHCGSQVTFPLPVKKQEACYDFFGDEAYRDSNDKYVLTYSLVGTNHIRLPNVEAQIREFKRQAVPAINPEDWILHMKDIWPIRARRRHPIFKSWSQQAVRALCNGLFALVRSFDEAFVIFNVSAVFYKSTDGTQLGGITKDVKHEAYTLLLMHVIDNATRHGVMPYLIFDSEKASEADKIIHEWASEAFQGSQLNLLYSYIARAIEIPEPVFVRPASRPCLEIADFVSYVIARYLHRRLIGRHIDLDPAGLRPVTYIGFDSSGDAIHTYGSEYPWRIFFGNV